MQSTNPEQLSSPLLPPNMSFTLVSWDGHEEVVERDVAEQCRLIRDMLQGKARLRNNVSPGSDINVTRLPLFQDVKEIPKKILLPNVREGDILTRVRLLKQRKQAHLGHTYVFCCRSSTTVHTTVVNATEMRVKKGNLATRNEWPPLPNGTRGLSTTSIMTPSAAFYPRLIISTSRVLCQLLCTL